MWLTKTMALRQRAERESAGTDMGVTTIGGGSASVMTRGEQRDLPVFSPSGLIWQPRAGDTVLVVKGGVGGQEQCIVAADTSAAAPENLAPGEVYLYAGGDVFLHLRSDGSIALKGNLSADGNSAIRGNVAVTGDVEVAGRVTVSGSLHINGDLFINGQPYRPCSCT